MVLTLTPADAEILRSILRTEEIRIKKDHLTKNIHGISDTLVEVFLYSTLKALNSPSKPLKNVEKWADEMREKEKRSFMNNEADSPSFGL